jgi:hypothetical protein
MTELPPILGAKLPPSQGVTASIYEFVPLAKNAPADLTGDLPNTDMPLVPQHRGFDGLIVSFLGSKPSSSDEERLEPFFSHRLTP